METESITGLLGMPIRDAAGLSDSVLRDEYARFAEQLAVVADGSVVLSSPYQLSVQTEGIAKSAGRWFAGLSEQDRCRLLLLSIVTRPFDSTKLWPDARSRFGNAEIVALLFSNENPQSLAEHDGGVPYGVSTVEGRKRLVSEPELKALYERLPSRAAIETLSAEFIGGMPGNYGYQMWQVARWTEEWAVVFGVTDASRDEGYPFPWLLGFCRTDPLERNFIALLREGSSRFDIGFYNTYGRVTSRWPLAELALVVDEDSEKPDWETIEWLLEMDDEGLRRLIRDHTRDVELSEFVMRVRDLRDSAEGLDLQETSLLGLLERAHADGSLKVLEAKIEEWGEAQAARDAGGTV
jgi:hypothetical protein